MKIPEAITEDNAPAILTEYQARYYVAGYNACRERMVDLEELEGVHAVDAEKAGVAQDPKPAPSKYDPFAPPTRCPVCGGIGIVHRRGTQQYPLCKPCNGSGEFIRTGIFVGHSCVRCSDGARPERCPSKVRGNCGEPMARND